MQLEVHQFSTTQMSSLGSTTTNSNYSNSGGAKMDKLLSLRLRWTMQIAGFHASKPWPPEFAEAYAKALSLSNGECLVLRETTRKSSERSSKEVSMKV